MGIKITSTLISSCLLWSHVKWCQIFKEFWKSLQDFIDKIKLHYVNVNRFNFDTAIWMSSLIKVRRKALLIITCMQRMWSRQRQKLKKFNRTWLSKKSDYIQSWYFSLKGHYHELFAHFEGYLWKDCRKV